MTSIHASLVNIDKQISRCTKYGVKSTSIILPFPFLPYEVVGWKTFAMFVYTGSSHRFTWKQQIDVMVLRDEAVLRRYFPSEYLETVIADELPYSNEAAANSLIDLRFNLVHTAKASGGTPDFDYRQADTCSSNADKMIQCASLWFGEVPIPPSMRDIGLLIVEKNRMWLAGVLNGNTV